MKQITLILGGSVRLYLNYIMLFSTIEKRFNCKIKKKNNFEFPLFMSFHKRFLFI